MNDLRVAWGVSPAHNGCRRPRRSLEGSGDVRDDEALAFRQLSRGQRADIFLETLASVIFPSLEAAGIDTNAARAWLAPTPRSRRYILRSSTSFGASRGGLVGDWSPSLPAAGDSIVSSAHPMDAAPRRSFSRPAGWSRDEEGLAANGRGHGSSATNLRLEPRVTHPWPGDR